jgi:hypothetical protein
MSALYIACVLWGGIILMIGAPAAMSGSILFGLVLKYRAICPFVVSMFSLAMMSPRKTV